MLDTTKLIPRDEIPPGTVKVIETAGTTVAVFNCDGEFHAIENACPHRGASLAAGSFTGTTVTCPLHAWEFDLVTGACRNDADSRVRRFDVQVDNGELRLEIPSTETTASQDDGISRYLIRYGKLGWVAWFGSIEQIECGHKEQVIVQTARGVELGEVLSAPDSSSSQSHQEKPTGELLRCATKQDFESLRALDVEPKNLLDDCEQRLRRHQVGVDVVDWERLLDGEMLILYFLGEQFPALETVAEELSQAHETTVQFFPLVEPPPSAGGCGAAGCGGNGCGNE